MAANQILYKGGVPIHVFTDDIDQGAIEQLGALSRLEIISGRVAVMPDVHVGIGATIGSVVPTRRALIPAAVGVDIGCGMTAVKLSLTANELPDDLKPARAAIENAVPVGRAGHQRQAAPHALIDELQPGLDQILETHPDITKRIRSIQERFRLQLGSLGGGNHFLELVLDESDGVWIMLHSGSRGIGNVIGRYFTRLAKDDMQRLDSRAPVGKDLHYFEEGSEHFDDYLHALRWAQRYALENRRILLRLTTEALRTVLPRFRTVDKVVECHHNYVAEEQHFGETVYVTRKGAIRACLDDRGIVPGSMGTRSYIVRGKGCSEALDSCPHGAGRRMSRTQAKAQFNAADMIAQTQGVECRKDEGVVDEIPSAYKNIDEVMRHAGQLVEIEHTLKQVICVKG
jgi:tRNA-splicing ligase RtcB